VGCRVWGVSAQKTELSQENKESQRMKSVCQQSLDDRQRFPSNERPVRFPDNSNSSNSFNNPNSFNNFSSFNNFNNNYEGCK
jgi:hypothetical protein